MTHALFLFDDGPVSVQEATASLQQLGWCTQTVPNLESLAGAVLGAPAPAVFIVSVQKASNALFEGMGAALAPLQLPLLMVVGQNVPGQAEQALAAGVHLLIEHDPHVSAPWACWLEWAQASQKRQALQTAELQALQNKLDERKTVERAKGLLMQARQVSDDEAFRILRTLSMHANQRLGEVSQYIIHTAHFAESVNRAGQLRMLSQRLAKLHLLRMAGVGQKQYKPAMSESARRIDEHLDWLLKRTQESIKKARVEPLAQSWQRLKAALDAPLSAAMWREIDNQAEALLEGAERLTGELEALGGVAPLHILNVAGRQRMLSQRYAKTALRILLEESTNTPSLQREMDDVKQHFETSLMRLNNVPLSTPDIRERLESAAVCWRQMQQAATAGAGGSSAHRVDRVNTVAQASETLLGLFDELSGQYQHSLDMLVG